MSVTLQNQNVACLQYQFMSIDVVAGKAYPSQTVPRGNPGLLAAANSAVATNTNVVCNLPGDDSALGLLTVAYETGHSILTTAPRWTGIGPNGKAFDLGAAYAENAVTRQMSTTARPAGAVGISQGAGTPSGTTKIALRPF